jgi:hypothetical protein
MAHVDGVDDGIGYGVSGKSTSLDGVRGDSGSGTGVWGSSSSGTGIIGSSSSGTGISGGSTSSYGVFGSSSSGTGVNGQSESSYGMHGDSDSGTGVWGSSSSGYGMNGESDSGTGVYGHSTSSDGVRGDSSSGFGVQGHSNSSSGVHGDSNSLEGVWGNSSSGNGVYGTGGSAGVYGLSDTGYAIYGRTDSGHAAYLVGNVTITGSLNKGGGSFKIDHPLDPANKYLYHSFVESPDMKNVYDGVAALDDKGEARIELPDWFGVLNKDFRYQLTAIGAPGPNLYIAEEISVTTTKHGNDDDSGDNNNENHFKIAGGTSGTKVSWQVTGIRRDPWANAHRVQVEEDKPDKERGYYIYPDLYGQPAENEISRTLFPEKARIAHK